MAPAGVAHPALTGDHDGDYFAQVQGDLAAGKFVGVLDLLDTHWPAGARMAGMQEARAYVGAAIVASLHAALAPLKMDAMLRTLKQVRTRLDEVIIGGQHLRDPLAEASVLDRDHLAYAPTVHREVRLSARPLALVCTEDPGDVVS